ncbi:intersectin-EH binding protein Ibp1 [Mycolicibacterium agri]|uniref:Intersectin-EH-binding protein Ibp1 n=1 Tax=Mycolicibacterium agri TaxID=36811 RepID=A0A2A7MWU0_MYCAG|nr:intersectin-EH binding protein Ibp1 [Mycolicibacterium agri]PEG36020.1 intersectin-EH binding protein Ibp1 [Mycolicibacterium agri]GFG54348.1 intersectin-EH-binding protein Ibp1 [Mycolicibacterium agri]
MATLHPPSRRLLLAGGFAVAIAAAPAAAVFAVAGAGDSAPTIAACPGGEIEDQFTNVCVPDLVPNSPSPQFTSTSPVGGLPEISGIPCTGQNTGQCIGLAEEQQAEGPAVVPHSEVSASP